MSLNYRWTEKSCPHTQRWCETLLSGGALLSACQQAQVSKISLAVPVVGPCLHHPDVVSFLGQKGSLQEMNASKAGLMAACGQALPHLKAERTEKMYFVDKKPT